MDSSGLAKSSGEREGVDSSDKCRLLVAVAPNSNMDDTVLYIVHAALCRSKEMLGGKILLTTAFKCWLLVCSSTSHGHWQAGLLYKVHKVHHTRFTRFTVQGSHGSLYKVHKVHYTSSTSHGHWQAGWCTIQGSAQWFSWWYVAVDFIWIWQTKDSKRLASVRFEMDRTGDTVADFPDMSFVHVCWQLEYQNENKLSWAIN